MELWLITIIIIVAVIIVGLGIFFATGIYHVKEGRVFIMEKYYEFYTLLEPGWYYFMPLIYHRRAWYSTEVQCRTYTLENKNTINIYYRIVDVVKYHYGAVKIYDHLMSIVNSGEPLTDDLLKEKFLEIGIEYIKIEDARNNAV
ncbi:MAG: SPFH domain-containing protein [Coprobacillus sp.]|nr:SPFH domain-containing protein [Coprobacillus sp.]